MTYTGTVPSGTLAVGSGLPALWTQQVGLSLAALEGAWQTYTPSLGNWTLGNGTIAGRYIQIGKFVVWTATLTFGTTTTAASSAPTFTLPVTAASNSVPYVHSLTRGNFSQSGVADYSAGCRYTSTTGVSAYILGTNGIHTVPTATTPFTWATNAQVGMSGVYESA